MSDFALVARADRGGIAAQSYEVFRHLHPRRVLVVDLGEGGRGPSDPGMYGYASELRVTEGPPDRGDAKWLTRRGISSIFCVEGLGSEAMREVLAHSGIRTILQANPELYRPDDLHGVNLEVVLPTEWEKDRIPEASRVLPVPVDTLDLTPTTRRPAQTDVRLLHMAGAAMADRNGTRIVLSAARNLKVPTTLLVANRPDIPNRRMGRTRLEALPDMPSHMDHWHTADPDILVLPRRYGGLSLPMQEAAACAIPIITLNVAPQNAWVPEQGLVGVQQSPARVSMKGGTFPVYGCEPTRLARVIDRFIIDDQLRLETGLLAREYAESISWDRLAPEYLELLA